MAAAFKQTGLANEFIPRFTICGVPDSLVDELRAPSIGQFLAYVDAMLERCAAVLEQTSEGEFSREIISGGRPRTVAQRAAGLSHVYRHVGMMENLRGLIRGPGQGTASI